VELKERLAFYNENYGFSYAYISKGEKFYIGSREDRHCRFCLRKKPEAKFRHVAHALPEFLGNKQIILLEECDECNKFFSENIEVHLDKFTRPFRLVGQIRGKSGVPSYKTRDGHSRIDFIPKQGFVISEVIDKRISEIDFEKQTLRLKITYEPYIPTAVYKCFVKMALSIMPGSELSFFTSTIKWIRNPVHSIKLIKPQLISQRFVPGPKPNRSLTVILFRKKQSSALCDIPYCMLVVAFGNIIYQLMVPSSNDLALKQLRIPLFPTPFEMQGMNLPSWTVDLTDHNVVRGQEKTIDFRYGGIEEIHPEA
jgi:hypothetical protein